MAPPGFQLNTIQPMHEPPLGADLARAIRWRLLGSFLVVGTLGFLVVAYGLTKPHELAHRLDDLDVLQAPVLLVLGAVLVAALVPAPLIAGAAGVLLGTGAGTVVGTLSLTFGACLCALFARRLGGQQASRAFGHRIAGAAAWLERRALRAVVLARLLPGAPFGPTSYLAGFMSVSLVTIATGTAIGIAPRAFAYAAIGGAISDPSDPSPRAALIAGIVVLVVTLIAGRFVPAAVRHDQ